MFGICPVNANKGSIWLHYRGVHWCAPGVKLPGGTCMPEFCEANIGEPIGRRALSVRYRTQAHL